MSRARVVGDALTLEWRARGNLVFAYDPLAAIRTSRGALYRFSARVESASCSPEEVAAVARLMSKARILAAALAPLAQASDVAAVWGPEQASAARLAAALLAGE